MPAPTNKLKESPRDLAIAALKEMLTDANPNVRLSAAKALLDYVLE